MIEQIPVTFEPVAIKDVALGAALALALRRGRIDSILDQYLPTAEEE